LTAVPILELHIETLDVQLLQETTSNTTTIDPIGSRVIKSTRNFYL
jgi:hypothetical protein